MIASWLDFFAQKIQIRGKNIMEFTNTFWALVPPIVAIVLALITKETYSSLFIGILVGALFVAGFNPVGTLDAMITEGFTPAISDNAGIFMFLVILGIMVALVNSTGAAAAFGKWAAKHVKSRAGTLFATFVLGKQAACMLFSKPIDPLAASGAILGDVWTDAKMPVVDSLGDEFLEYVKTGAKVTVKDDGVVEVE